MAPWRIVTERNALHEKRIRVGQPFASDYVKNSLVVTASYEVEISHAHRTSSGWLYPKYIYKVSWPPHDKNATVFKWIITAVQLEWPTELTDCLCEFYLLACYKIGHSALQSRRKCAAVCVGRVLDTGPWAHNEVCKYEVCSLHESYSDI